LGNKPDVNLARHYNIGKEYKINPMTRQGKNLPAKGLRIRGSPLFLLETPSWKKIQESDFFLTKSARDVIIPPQPTKGRKPFRALYWIT
jgi:hypothetical protein